MKIYSTRKKRHKKVNAVTNESTSEIIAPNLVSPVHQSSHILIVALFSLANASPVMSRASN